MEWNNVCLVRDDYAKLFELPTTILEAYVSGYYRRANREKVFWWKGEEARCFEKTTKEAFEYLKEYWKLETTNMVLEVI